jgi:hypothetical protein
MNDSLEHNLRCVNTHIREVQSGNINAETPKLESLGLILSGFSKKVLTKFSDKSPISNHIFNRKNSVSFEIIEEEERFRLKDEEEEMKRIE